jgi:RNA polymerase sigma-70 factor (ECF subfamily)
MSTAAMTGDARGRADDNHLARRIARAEPGAFEEFVALYQPRVTRLTYRLLGWGGNVEDVVQDVFLAALGKAGSFRGDASLWTWLTIITLNRCRTDRRRRLLRFRVHDLLSRSGACEESAADRAAIEDETAREVRAAVAALPPRDREVIVLYYLEHRTTDEISRLLSVSRNAIEVRLHRARGRLRQTLQTFMKE